MLVYANEFVSKTTIGTNCLSQIQNQMVFIQLDHNDHFKTVQTFKAASRGIRRYQVGSDSVVTFYSYSKGCNIKRF